MKLSIAIDLFVARKRANGLIYEQAATCYGQFCRAIGDVELSELTTKQVLKFVSPELTSTNWGREKYQLVTRLFRYWASRQEMPHLLLPPPKRVIKHRVFNPYIFTRLEIRRLLSATSKNHLHRYAVIHGQTFRTLILVLYGSGLFLKEALTLKCADVHLEKGILDIHCGRACRERKIPIGDDLQGVLERYVAWRSRNRIESDLLFVNIESQPLVLGTVIHNFKRLREIAGVARSDGARRQPRLQDFRFTFAVHRITSWIRNGADLNRMLPALAVYMGQSGLGSINRYLSLTPERFRRHLDRLSPPARKGRHWRDDRDLIRFLTAL